MEFRLVELTRFLQTENTVRSLKGAVKMKCLPVLTFLTILLLSPNLHSLQAQKEIQYVGHAEKREAARTTKSIVLPLIRKLDAAGLERMKTKTDRNLMHIVNGYWIDEYWKLIDANDREFGIYGIDQPSQKHRR